MIRELSHRYAELLAAELAGWGVVEGVLSEVATDPLISINPYKLHTDVLTGADLYGLQIHIRGNPNDGVAPVQLVHEQIEQLLSLEPRTIPDVVIAWRVITTPLRPDAKGRPEIFDTYWVRTDRLAQVG